MTSESAQTGQKTIGDTHTKQRFPAPLIQPENNPIATTGESASSATKTMSGITAGVVFDKDDVYGIDFYNNAITGKNAMTLSSRATDSHHVPCVCVKENYFNTSNALNALEKKGGTNEGV